MSNLGVMTLAEPIPKNLRAILTENIARMTEEQLLSFHNFILEAEIERLLKVVSDDAEKEQAEGKWDNLSEIIQAYRERKKAERRASS